MDLYSDCILIEWGQNVKKIVGKGGAGFLNTCTKNVLYPMTALVLKCPGMFRTSWSRFNYVFLTALYHPEIILCIILILHQILNSSEKT